MVTDKVKKYDRKQHEQHDWDILKKLCEINGISGDEKFVRDLITKEIFPYVDDVKVDNLGNLIIFKKGSKRSKTKLMLAAHMDEVGLIATCVTQDGYIGFDKVGGIDDRILLGKNVLIGTSQISGVICVKPIHLCDDTEKKVPIEAKDMFIDIGADSEEQALNYVNLGDRICFSTIFDTFSGKIRAKALDDRVGCGILLDILKSKTTFDAYFVFTVQEEVGLRGAKVAAYNIMPDVAIVVEATTACDILGVDKTKCVCEVGGGAVLSFMDSRTVYDADLYKLAVKTAEENNIKYQIKKGVAGGNDSGAIQTAGNGVRTLVVSVACRYLHTPTGMISMEDYFRTKNLVEMIFERICAGEL
jgi:endoglucanase